MPIPEPVDFDYAAVVPAGSTSLSVDPDVQRPSAASCLVYLETLNELVGRQFELEARRQQLLRELPDTLLADLRALKDEDLTGEELAACASRRRGVRLLMEIATRREEEAGRLEALRAHEAHQETRPEGLSGGTMTLQDRFAASEWLREDMVLYMMTLTPDVVARAREYRRHI